MIDAYEFNQRTFSTKGPQCVYSARELTRWCRALEQASDNCSSASALVRLWLHEGLRLFADRLPEMNDVDYMRRRFTYDSTEALPYRRKL